MSSALWRNEYSDRFATYLFEYGHKGARWGIEVKATDAEDAKERVRALAFAQLRGEVVTKMPLSVFGAALTPFKSLLRHLRKRG